MDVGAPVSLLLLLPSGPAPGPTTLAGSVFGPRTGSYDVEQAVIMMLTERLPTYVNHCAQLHGITNPTTAGFPVRPAQPPFARKNFGGWPEHHLPSVQVVCPGMAERPVRQEDGSFTLTWQVEVFVIVSGRDHDATRLVRAVYEDALGMCIMQDRSLRSTLHPTGFAAATDWLGESSADVPVPESDNRTLQGTVVVLSVMVENCLDADAGPAIFIPDDGTPPHEYPDDPLSEDVEVAYQVTAVNPVPTVAAGADLAAETGDTLATETGDLIDTEGP